MIRRLFLLLSALCLLVSAGWAQSFRGAITGTIQDSSGSLVAKAKVVATETTTNVQRETATSSTGGYLFGDLPPGTYRVTVSMSGFKEVASGDIIHSSLSMTRWSCCRTCSLSGAIWLKTPRAHEIAEELQTRIFLS
jgi:hypothetical protein